MPDLNFLNNDYRLLLNIYDQLNQNKLYLMFNFLNGNINRSGTVIWNNRNILFIAPNVININQNTKNKKRENYYIKNRIKHYCLINLINYIKS